MSAQKRKTEINLLPEKGFESTTTGRILAWILSTFRVIVIVTEIIVMVAFLSRFWLDAQNSDLNERIEQKQAVLAASQNFERQFKATQKRLETFTSITTNQPSTTDLMQDVVAALPRDIVLTSLILTGDNLEITGTTPNEKSIQQLLVNLNSKDKFSKFSVTGISNDLENISALDFSVKGNVVNTK